MLGRLSELSLTRALAELLIIIVGVLAALGVDEWRQTREERSLELRYLQSLQIDLRQDIERIDVLGGRTFMRHAGATRLLLDLGEDHALSKDDPALWGRSVDALMREAEAMPLPLAVSQAARVFILDTSSPTFDELRSTGHLQLIQNTDLKRSIAEYYRAVEGSHFIDGEQELVIWDEFQGLLAGHGIAVFDTRTSEDLDLLSRLERIPNLSAAIRRVRSAHAVQAIYTAPLRSQAESLLSDLDAEISARW